MRKNTNIVELISSFVKPGTVVPQGLCARGSMVAFQKTGKGRREGGYAR